MTTKFKEFNSKQEAIQKTSLQTLLEKHGWSKRISTEDEALSRFIEMRVKDLNKNTINESLIASYGVNKLQDEIKNRFGEYIIHLGGSEIPLPIQQTKYGYVFSFNITFKPDFITHKNNFIKLLNLYGYYISKERITNENAFAYLIEPAHTAVFDLKSNNIPYLFHITEKKYLDKILKFGLIPKTSKTTFAHTGNYIYFCYTKNMALLQDWKDKLKTSKEIIQHKR